MLAQQNQPQPPGEQQQPSTEDTQRQEVQAAEQPSKPLKLNPKSVAERGGLHRIVTTQEAHKTAGSNTNSPGSGSGSNSGSGTNTPRSTYHVSEKFPDSAYSPLARSPSASPNSTPPQRTHAPFPGVLGQESGKRGRSKSRRDREASRERTSSEGEWSRERTDSQARAESEDEKTLPIAIPKKR